MYPFFFFPFLSFPFFLFSRLEKKSLAPLSPLSSLSSNAFKTASPYERCSLERTIFDGGREARFLCEKLSVRSLLPKGTLFFTGLVSLIYPVILEPCGTIRTFVRLPELVHPLDENKKRNKVLACSSFTATYYKQGAAEIFREIFPRLFPYRAIRVAGQTTPLIFRKRAVEKFVESFFLAPYSSPRFSSSR